jgi:hypothetical protein
MPVQPRSSRLCACAAGTVHPRAHSSCGVPWWLPTSLPAAVPRSVAARSPCSGGRPRSPSAIRRAWPPATRRGSRPAAGRAPAARARSRLMPSSSSDSYDDAPSRGAGAGAGGLVVGGRSWGRRGGTGVAGGVRRGGGVVVPGAGAAAAGPGVLARPVRGSAVRGRPGRRSWARPGWVPPERTPEPARGCSTGRRRGVRRASDRPAPPADPVRRRCVGSDRTSASRPVTYVATPRTATCSPPPGRPAPRARPRRSAAQVARTPPYAARTGSGSHGV